LAAFRLLIPGKLASSSWLAVLMLTRVGGFCERAVPVVNSTNTSTNHGDDLSRSFIRSASDFAFENIGALLQEFFAPLIDFLSRLIFEAVWHRRQDHLLPPRSLS
jgi:hypothetical protein